MKREETIRKILTETKVKFEEILSKDMEDYKDFGFLRKLNTEINTLEWLLSEEKDEDKKETK